MAEDDGTIQSEFDEAIKNQSDDPVLQPSFLCLLSLKEIIKVCSNEFHEGILLRNNDGIVTNYLPDMLDAFCNSIDQLGVIMSPYEDDDFKKFEKKHEFKNREDKRKYYLEFERAILGLMKRINVMPGENMYGVEIVGLTKAERKALEKKDKAEAVP